MFGGRKCLLELALRSRLTAMKHHLKVPPRSRPWKKLRCKRFRQQSLPVSCSISVRIPSSISEPSLTRSCSSFRGRLHFEAILNQSPKYSNLECTYRLDSSTGMEIQWKVGKVRIELYHMDLACFGVTDSVASMK